MDDQIRKGWKLTCWALFNFYLLKWPVGILLSRVCVQVWFPEVSGLLFAVLCVVGGYFWTRFPYGEALFIPAKTVEGRLKIAQKATFLHLMALVDSIFMQYMV